MRYSATTLACNRLCWSTLLTCIGRPTDDAGLDKTRSGRHTKPLCKSQMYRSCLGTQLATRVLTRERSKHRGTSLRRWIGLVSFCSAAASSHFWAESQVLAHDSRRPNLSSRKAQHVDVDRGGGRPREAAVMHYCQSGRRHLHSSNILEETRKLWHRKVALGTADGSARTVKLCRVACIPLALVCCRLRPKSAVAACRRPCLYRLLLVICRLQFVTFFSEAWLVVLEVYSLHAKGLHKLQKTGQPATSRFQT